jgi:hypothetical protein
MRLTPPRLANRRIAGFVMPVSTSPEMNQTKKATIDMQVKLQTGSKARTYNVYEY